MRPGGIGTLQGVSLIPKKKRGEKRGKSGEMINIQLIANLTENTKIKGAKQGSPRFITRDYSEFYQERMDRNKVLTQRIYMACFATWHN